MSQPVVTVIMAMRNAERYVADSARSARLAQEGVNLELIVVDDWFDRSLTGDRRADRKRRHRRVRIVDGPWAGIAMAVNTGLAAAQGEFVSRCDSDDLYPPDRLRRRPNGCAGTRTSARSAARSKRSTREAGWSWRCTPRSRPRSLKNSWAGQTRTHFSTFLTRADVLRRLGGPLRYFEHAEDVDLQLRIGGDVPRGLRSRGRTPLPDPRRVDHALPAGRAPPIP